MKKGYRSVCPVARSLDILGDTWSLIIIRDLYLGKIHFSELTQSPERIASSILSNRLEKLLRQDIVENFDSPLYKGKQAYRLTKKGKDLEPVVSALAKWGMKHIEGAEMRLKPKK